MKLGVNTGFITKFPFAEGLDWCQRFGVVAVEVSAVGSTNEYCQTKKLLADDGARERWLEAYASRGIELYSFGGHGKPLHPDREIASTYTRDFAAACRLAEKVGVTRMTLVSGLPEGGEGDRVPNWVTHGDAQNFDQVVEWQWQERLLPYWREQGRIASDYGVTLCFEMQICDMVHTPAKLRRLRDEIGPVVACNYDVSHMWVQGIDPFEAIHYLADLIQNAHMKDTLIHQPKCRLHGMFDTTGFDDYRERAWTFAQPGYGHGPQVWQELIATLRFIGYDGILSLEMESDYLEVQEGLEQAARLLGPLVTTQPLGDPWWKILEEAQAKGAASA